MPQLDTDVMGMNQLTRTLGTLMTAFPPPDDIHREARAAVDAVTSEVRTKFEAGDLWQELSRHNQNMATAEQELAALNEEVAKLETQWTAALEAGTSPKEIETKLFPVRAKRDLVSERIAKLTSMISELRPRVDSAFRHLRRDALKELVIKSSNQVTSTAADVLEAVRLALVPVLREYRLAAFTSEKARMARG